MANAKVGKVRYEVTKINYGVHKCDKCGQQSGCLNKVVNLSNKFSTRICYQCTGNHWKRALKIHIEDYKKARP